MTSQFTRATGSAHSEQQLTAPVARRASRSFGLLGLLGVFCFSPAFFSAERRLYGLGARGQQRRLAHVARRAEGEIGTDILERCRAMRVKELRTELGTRGIAWADALDKDELVERLAKVLAEESSFSKSGRFRPGQVASLTGSELEEELKDGSTPLLLDVYATWCGPCQFMAPFLEAAAKKWGGKMRVAKLDSDSNPEKSTQLKVYGLPTLILYDRQGNEMFRKEGAHSEAQLLQMVNNAGVL
eukprot:TRINITY_DN21714_c0_g1_i1.p1 TRINITY_DN21714_c0_g1~~TRINITY_DN21714_c0_g1_i1.p1  ORF type:complete len:243 (-),score=51.77 TRINITY_DN21714_c0_g1_i1:229-957(-)